MSRAVLAWCLLMLGLGVAGGLLWLWLADPAMWEVTKDGIILTEDAVRGQFSAVVTFILVGAALSFGWSWAAGHALRDTGWIRVPVFAVAAGVAALIAWQVGAHLGPSDPRDVADPALGDRLPSELRVDAVAPFLLWPIFALLGLLWDSWLQQSDEGDDELTERSEPSPRS